MQDSLWIESTPADNKLLQTHIVKVQYVCPSTLQDIFVCVLLQTHHKHSLHSGDALAEYGAELIPYTSQEEAEQRYPKQRIDNAEDPSTFCVGGGVPKTCREVRR